jgi:hypothetical protein
MTNPSSVPHAYNVCKVPQSSTEYQAQIQLQKTRELFKSIIKNGNDWWMGNNSKSDIEYKGIFKHGQDNIYAVDDVLNQLDTSKMQSSF